MAYSTFKKGLRGRPRPLRRNRRYIKKRVVRSTVRSAYRRRPMKSTRKRILDITSRKKQDSMQVWTGTPFSADPNSAPVEMKGNHDYEFCWIATAREKVMPGGDSATVENDTMRTATSCYMRGLKERITILTGSPQPWIWRRVVFCYKGSDLITVDTPTHGVGQLFHESSNGYSRFYPNLLDITDPRSAVIGDQIKSVVFKGKIGTDYTSSFDAKVNRERVNVISDQTRQIKSSNDRGVIRTFNHWYPFNKNLVYNENEEGLDVTDDFYSANSSRSMGDVYVYDMFTCGLGGGVNDELRLLPTATLYWHER